MWRNDQMIIKSVPSPTAILATAVVSGIANAISNKTGYIAESSEIFGKNFIVGMIYFSLSCSKSCGGMTSG